MSGATSDKASELTTSPSWRRVCAVNGEIFIIYAMVSTFVISTIMTPFGVAVSLLKSLLHNSIYFTFCIIEGNSRQS